MHQVYMISALIGGAILLIQLILMMVGGDADGDMDFSADVDDVSVSGSEFFDYLSLKSVFSFLTFFGLAGLAVDSSEWRPFPGATLVVALGAGCIAFYIVGLIMVGLSKLESSGNIDLKTAVDGTAQVYLRIPAQNQGAGKVTVTLQGRQVEVRAVTAGDELATGQQVQVIRYLQPDTLEVVGRSS